MCLGDLRMTPAAFWAMSPREIAAILRVRQSGTGRSPAAFGRRDLDRLMSLYPDKPNSP